MTCKDILPACFDGAYRFAGDLRSREGAVEYLKCLIVKLDVWLEVEQDIEDYLRRRDVPEAQIKNEIEEAGRLLKPWLPGSAALR
jgi:hypothetical protein